MSRFCLVVFGLLALSGSVTAAVAQTYASPVPGREDPRATRNRLVAEYTEQYRTTCLPMLMPDGIGAVNRCDAALQANLQAQEAAAGLPYMSPGSQP
jgi:hypothetical protein